MSDTCVYIGASLTISSLDQLWGSSPNAIICFVSQEEQRWVVIDFVQELYKISLPLFSSCPAWCPHILSDTTLEGGRDFGAPRGT